MRKKLLTSLTLLIFLTLSSFALAAAGIELKSTAQTDIIVKNAKGEKEVVRVEAASANILPGDTIIFSTHYVNQGEKPATDIVITNPMPEHMLYLDGTAEGKGARIEFSADQGKSYASAGKLKVKDSEGRDRSANAADYTHIRWIIEGALEKGAKGSVSFKAKVK